MKLIKIITLVFISALYSCGASKIDQSYNDVLKDTSKAVSRQAETTKDNAKKIIKTEPKTELKTEIKLVDNKNLIILKSGKWLLLSAKENPPYLDFTNADMKLITGFSGCNRIGGELLIDGQTIKISKIITTKMACMDNNDETGFLALLEKVNRYEMADKTLTFFVDKINLLRFKLTE